MSAKTVRDGRLRVAEAPAPYAAPRRPAKNICEGKIPVPLVYVPTVVEINPRRFTAPPTDEELLSFIPMRAVEEESGRLDASQVRPWKEVKKGYTPFQEGDVIFAKITPCMENGKFALAKGLHNGRAAGSTEFHVFRPGSTLDAKYLMYFLFSPKLRSDAKRKMQGAAGQLRVTTEFFSTVEIPLPTIEEQRLIVSEIERQCTRLDAGVEALRRAQSNLKRYRAAVLKAACEGQLAPGDAPRFPGGPQWPRVSLGDVVESMKNGIYKSRDIYSEGGTACLRMYNIEDGRIVWKRIKRMKLSRKEVEEYGLLPGDLLVNRVNSRELVGKAAPIPIGLEECVFESKNIRVRVKRNLADPRFVSYAMSLYGQSHFNRNAQQVVGMASISQPQVGALQIPLPPLEEQERIVMEVELQLSVIEELQSTVMVNLQRATRLRQAVLQQAFAGELVPE